VEIDKLTYVVKVKLLLNESLPFSGGERMEMVLNNIGVVDLPKHRQKNLIDLKRLLLIVKINARLRDKHITENDKDAEDIFREYA
jgi:hypothetical protein